ncbi:hypothetical protein DFH09DRAFT_1404717 [Mycena vulgaris]|nr:hypothetical protein DFH09DRAFT_1404717 [Mycena vulgaris]
MLRLSALCAMLSSVVAHTHMFFPEPRNRQDYAFSNSGDNACENDRTDLTEQAVFFRGQSFEPKWWWNNHDGGFIKFALTGGHPAKVDNKDMLANENIINGQCYTGGCNKDGFDPGNTHECIGKNVTIPNWVSDGDYVFSFSSIGGFNSDAVPTKQLPLYHNCANIRVQGGAPLEDRPANWVAPFIGGSQDNVKGQPIPPDTCAFKNFRAEPTDASIVDVNDVRDNMEFGLPDGWAVPGGSPPPPPPQAPVAPVTPVAPSAPVTAPAVPSAPVVSPPVQDNTEITTGEDEEETSEDGEEESGEVTAGSDEDATGEEDEATGDEELEDDSGSEDEGQEDFEDDSDDSEEDLERRHTEEAILPRLGHVARALRRRVSAYSRILLDSCHHFVRDSLRGHTGKGSYTSQCATLEAVSVHVVSALRFLKTTPLYEFPPRDLFVTETDINRVLNRSDVVQPLVGAHDTFDIAVTAWQLATFEEQIAQYLHLQQKKADANEATLPWAEVEDEAAYLYHEAYVKWYDDISPLEKTIFSDIIFRDVRLSDTDLHTNLTFQIPTKTFDGHPGTNYDLRASFVILPHPPSPLDHFKNFSSWFPAAVHRPRFKSFRFPIISSTEDYRRPIHRALDSFAIDIPLLERHGVPSVCPARMNHSKEGLEYYNDYPDHSDILLKHPHVVTRTQLRIVHESRLFRRDGCLGMHDHLRNVSLAVPDPEAEGGFRDEFAYAPYMDVLPIAAGPKDIVPVPVNREQCGMYGNPVVPGNRTVSDHMNITWQLSYTSVSPRMFVLGDLPLPPMHRSHYNNSDFSRAMKHNVAEIHSALYGHRYDENSHPRRRFASLILSTLASFFLLLLNCIYWGSRTTRAYISVPGTLLIANAVVLDLSTVLHDVLSPDISDRREGGEKVIGLILSLMHGDRLLPVLMLRAVSPVEVFREGATERASARLDARTDWRWKCGIFAALLLVHYTLYLHTRFIIAPIMPEHRAGDLPHALSTNMTILVGALSMAGAIIQLILNHRAKVFAGRYKVAVMVHLALQVLRYGDFVPALMGRPEVLAGLSYADLLWDVVLWVTCWQAWRYSSRIPKDEDGENENRADEK